MRKYLVRASVACLLSGVSATAAADELRLSIAGGRVTLVAQNVPVRQILAEWARIGQSVIVNADQVSGPPVTLQLVDVPEREALDVLLRSVSGYVVAPRSVTLADASQFDRILILPTSRPPANPAVPAMTAAPPPFPMQPPVLDVQNEEMMEGQEFSAEEQMVPAGSAYPQGPLQQIQPVAQPFPMQTDQNVQPGQVPPPVISPTPGVIVAPAQPDGTPPQHPQNPYLLQPRPFEPPKPPESDR